MQWVCNMICFLVVVVVVGWGEEWGGVLTGDVNFPGASRTFILNVASSTLPGAYMYCPLVLLLFAKKSSFKLSVDSNFVTALALSCYTS